MFNALFEGEVVDIMTLLDAREQRQYLQKTLLERYSPAPLVSVTLNIPGAVKYSPQLEQLAAHLMEYIDQSLQDSPLLYKKETIQASGIEFFRVYGETPEVLKQRLIQLESNHPLGRLLDLDVLILEQGQPTPISREQVGGSRRKCYLCDNDAKVCARSRTHSVEEMQSYIQQQVVDYFSKEIII